MTKKRIATLATCIALVGTVAVGGTLALISSQSKQLTNTFTVGGGYNERGSDFILKEHAVTQDPVDGGYDAKVPEKWVMGTTAPAGDKYPGNNYADLVPNTDLAKDPTFAIDTDCEVAESWIVAKVSGLNTLKGAGISVSAVAEANKWLVLESLDATTVPTENAKVNTYTNDDDGTVYLIYSQKVARGTTTDPLFTTMRAGANVTADNTNLDIKGVAVQALNNSTLDDATLKQILAAAKTKLN